MQSYFTEGFVKKSSLLLTGKYCIIVCTRYSASIIGRELIWKKKNYLLFVWYCHIIDMASKQSPAKVTLGMIKGKFIKILIIKIIDDLMIILQVNQ